MLFNKDDHGSEEIFEISGTFQASTPYKAIATEVEAATSTLREIVGSAVIEKAEKIYEKNAPEESEKEYLDKVRRPVALLAICNYSKITGLSHGASGRKMTVGDNEKVPFEWMIDRDDREMKERYFRSLDTLLSYLTKEDDSAWKESEIHDVAAASIVSTIAQFEAVYPLNHSYYTYYMLLPLLMDAQYQLSVIIGADKLEEIIKNEKKETLQKVRKYLVLSALVTALKRWAISIFPLEIARQFAPSYQGNKENRAATKDEIEWTLTSFQKQLTEAQTEIMSDISGNPWEKFSPIPKNDPQNKYFTV